MGNCGMREKTTDQTLFFVCLGGGQGAGAAPVQLYAVVLTNVQPHGVGLLRRHWRLVLVLAGVELPEVFYNPEGAAVRSLRTGVWCLPLNSRRPGQLLRRNRRHVLEKRQVPGLDDGERDCDAVLRALHDRVEALCSVAVRAHLQGHRDQDSVQQRRCAAVASPARPQRIQAPAASLFVQLSTHKKLI